MPILYIDGARLEKAVVVAAQRLLDCQERIDRINVFPIPDGDTGTNMALTLKSVAEGAINASHRAAALAPMSEVLAESALMGSCGNSGAILAQFFQGMAEAFQGKMRVNGQELARAMVQAVASAERAIVNPVEGTILTVMREWAAFLEKEHKGTDCIAELLVDSLAAAQRALRETPQKLKVLQRAGVVDAGAQGFVNMLEAVVDYIRTGTLVWAPPLANPATEARREEAGIFRYRFCSECVLVGAPLDLARIRQVANGFGDSLIVVGNSRKVRVHVHTNQPEDLFEKLSTLGRLDRRKFDDMQAQYDKNEEGRKIALIVDSSCDLPTDYIIKHQIRMVPVRVSFGAQTYLDRVNITGEEIYRLMGLAGPTPTTSQPSAASFHQAFDLAAEKHQQAIALTLSGAVSGTYQACCNAASQARSMKITAIDSHTTAGALGLLTMVAAEAIQEGLELEQVIERIEKARPRTRLLALLPNLEYLVRGGRISRFRGWLARVFNLVPILTFNPQGRIQAVARTSPGPKGLKKLLHLVQLQCRDLQNPRFLICHAANEAAAEHCQTILQDRFQIEHIPILPVSPTLGVHAGPGAVAICFSGQ